jgi:diguanylate cyclase (GGDEF)-like protein
LCIALPTLVVVTGLALVLLPSIETDARQASANLLAREARLVSALVVERLTIADQLVRTVAAASDAPDPIPLTPFSNVVVLQDNNTKAVLKGTVPELAPLAGATVSMLMEGRTVLVANRAGKNTDLILLRATSTLNGGGESLLLAQLAPGYVLGPASSANERHGICIVGQTRKPLLCNSVSVAAELASVKSKAGNGKVHSPWRNLFAGDNPVALSPLDIEQSFGNGNWSIAVMEPAPAPVFEMTTKLAYVLAGMLAIFLSGWLASRLTRQGSNPVSPPVARRGKAVPPATTRSTGSEAGGAVQGGNPEKVDRKFATLALLSEIDRGILSGATFERIVDSVFERICAILPGDAGALALLDREKPSRCKMLIITGNGKRQAYRIEDALDARSTSELELIPDGNWFDSSANDALLAPLHQLGLKRCLLFPVFKEGIPAGALIIAYETERTFADTEYSLARDLAHRLGVAYTSAARGQELLFHSLYDSTTELPNRKFFENRIEEEISRARRESKPLALLLVDLDNFKKINDTYGHDGGDILHEQASARLRACLRSEDVVARVGSDEFGILLPTVSEDEDALNVAEKLIEALSEPYTLGSQQQHLSATVGVAVFPRDGQTSRAMLQSADFALNDAKRSGGGRYSAYEPQSGEQAQDQAVLANDLRHAITKSELRLYFQPQIDLQRGEIVGAEALVRWEHRTRGMVMPGSFINIAEQSDLIDQVGEFVRQAASAQFREWEKVGIAPMRVSVNVSSREVKRKDFVSRIENTLITSGLRPFSLELEITESLLLDNANEVLATLKALNDRGVRIAIDDFGTGYSSMAYLKNLPFHVLKIDRSFVKDIGTADGSDSIVNAIIGVAQSLGKEIVAEGIELESQRAFLKENGCDIGQGYLWSRPVPADEFAAFVRNWNYTARRVAAIE